MSALCYGLIREIYTDSRYWFSVVGLDERCGAQRGSCVSLPVCVYLLVSSHVLLVFMSWINGNPEINDQSDIFSFSKFLWDRKEHSEPTRPLSTPDLSHSQETPHSHFLNHWSPSDHKSISTSSLHKQHHSLYAACNVNALADGALQACNPTDIFCGKVMFTFSDIPVYM